MAAFCGNNVLQTDVGVFCFYFIWIQVMKSVQNVEFITCDEPAWMEVDCDKSFPFLLRFVPYILYKKNMITSTAAKVLLINCDAQFEFKQLP